MNNPVIDVLEVLNNITDIHNCLVNDYENEAFYKIGVFTENLANRLRNDNDTTKTTELDK